MDQSSYQKTIEGIYIIYFKFKRILVLFEISTLLNTGLSMDSLPSIVSLVESGVNPESIIGVVQYLKNEENTAKKVIS
jgi:hypothetical protein